MVEQQPHPARVAQVFVHGDPHLVAELHHIRQHAHQFRLIGRKSKVAAPMPKPALTAISCATALSQRKAKLSRDSGWPPKDMPATRPSS